MKKLLKILSIYILLGFSFVACFAQVPMNWTRDEINPDEDFTITSDEAFFTEGYKSCHLQLNSGAVPYLYSDVFYINPDEEYQFSLDIYDNDTNGQVKIYADFYDMYGFHIFGQPPVFSRDSSTWQTISWDGTIPGQAVVGYVMLKYYCQPDLYNFTTTSHIWVDNISFRDVMGNNLLANGGFEEWNVDVTEMRGEEVAILVYPNPAADFVNFVLEIEAEFIIITDLSGRVILRLDVLDTGIIKADVSTLQKGIYIVSAIHQNKMVVVRKLLVD